MKPSLRSSGLAMPKPTIYGNHSQTSPGLVVAARQSSRPLSMESTTSACGSYFPRHSAAQVGGVRELGLGRMERVRIAREGEVVGRMTSRSVFLFFPLFSLFLGSQVRFAF